VGAWGISTLIRLDALFISVSLLIAFANQSQAFYITEEQRCSTVDLRTDLPMKMRNQGDISWCYAHASADYLQFYNRIPTQISAADIATLYNQRRWPRLVRWLIGGVVPETGFARSAMDDISQTGYCPEDYFPSESWTKRILNGPFAGQLIEVPIKKAIEELFQLADGVSSGIYRKTADLPYSYEFKGVSAEAVAQAVLSNPDNVLNEVRSAACDSHRMPFPKFPTDIRMEWKGKNTFTEINRILDRRQPLTVDYFYGFLQNIDDYAYSVSDLHTTMLMGRKFDPASGECRYLIKNSYGTSCDEYDRRHQCEAGYVWVSELSLYGAMTSYVHIARSQDQFTGTAEQIQDEPARR
jgi:hypothetical protein